MMIEKDINKIMKDKEKLRNKFSKTSRDYMVNCLKLGKSFTVGSGILYSSLAEEQSGTLSITSSTFLAMNDKQGLADFLFLVEGVQRLLAEKIADIKADANIHL